MSLQNLVIIGGTVLVAGSVAIMYWDDGTKNKKYLKKSYYKESIALLNGYKPAVDVLGEPIKIAKINENDRFNDIQEKNVKLKLPINGKKRNADLLIYASKRPADEDQKWIVDKLEIQYSGSGNRYKFFDNDLRKQL